MKYIVIICILSLLLFIACEYMPKGCTKESRICPDGTSVGRNNANWCEFDQCPKAQECGVVAMCPNGSTCYAFSKGNYCYNNDPCIAECGGGDCEILETFPVRIRCLE